ncbi:hypothetical protein IL54_0181 [Sphingobium sp. ba1]|jgi:hypothetical protein|nr:hypothetical protein IL54_0181 [Sphingobium sp. ba1]
MDVEVNHDSPALSRVDSGFAMVARKFAMARMGSPGYQSTICHVFGCKGAP